MSTTDSKSGSSTYNIDKLTESNYRSWAQQMEWILDEKDLWEIVNGSERRPVRPIATEQSTEQSTSATANTVDLMVEFDQKLDDFVKRSKKARSTIGASISASIMVYIEGMKDPAGMWKALEDKYNPKTQTTLFQTIREFMNAKMSEGDDMEKHLQRVQRLKRQCEEQGEEISDNVYNAILLNSVPDEYRIAVSILESQEKLAPATVINRLMEEYRKLGGDNGGGSGKMVMALLTNQGGKKQS